MEGNPSQIGEGVDLTLDHDENQKVDSEELIENASVDGDGQNEEQINAQLEYEEEGGIDYNIIHVSKARDLSPRHTDSLETKRGRPKTPLQVRTRSNNGRTVSCNQ